MSGTRGSSGLGSHSKLHMDNNTGREREGGEGGREGGGRGREREGREGGRGRERGREGGGGREGGRNMISIYLIV